MFISKCISVLASCVLSINTSAVWNTPLLYGQIYESSTRIEYPIEIYEPIEEITEPVVEVEEDIIEEEIEEEPVVELPLTEAEIDLVALVTMAEAEGECEEGKRLVIDVILNRLDSPRFPDTIHGVIYAKNQFEPMTNGRIDRCYVRDDIRQLVIEELECRISTNVYYFRTDHYHNFGIPVMQVGNHYFSTY